ncbi:hypothetical protein T459_19421 [Capsicum annuum]|uniref:Uncharacterized protein n=1 Tax=Capsicum annuum TaxID=4072 RepID=A0A2G2Z1N7_CAPAN|nr:hypothetical protein T459_19421 [Capsicum annuum]
MNNESPQSAGKVQIWVPPNQDLLVNVMNTFVPHVVMKNKNIIPQTGSALVPLFHAEELGANGKFKAVSISVIHLSQINLDGSHFGLNDTSITNICKLYDIRQKVNTRKSDLLDIKAENTDEPEIIYWIHVIRLILELKGQLMGTHYSKLDLLRKENMACLGHEGLGDYSASPPWDSMSLKEC